MGSGVESAGTEAGKNSTVARELGGNWNTLPISTI